MPHIAHAVRSRLQRDSITRRSPDILLEVYIWALWFIETELYPDIELPAEIREDGRLLWNYFKSYDFAAADEFAEGPWDDRFVAMADLATHIAHIL